MGPHAARLQPQLHSGPFPSINIHLRKLTHTVLVLMQVLCDSYSVAKWIWHLMPLNMGLPGGASGKESACQCRRHKNRGFNPWVRKIPWRRAWQPIPVLPGESHGQRSLAGCSPRVENSWQLSTKHNCCSDRFSASCFALLFSLTQSQLSVIILKR